MQSQLSPSEPINVIFKDLFSNIEFEQQRAEKLIEDIFQKISAIHKNNELGKKAPPIHTDYTVLYSDGTVVHTLSMYIEKNRLNNIKLEGILTILNQLV